MSKFTERFTDRLSARSSRDPLTLAAAGAGVVAAGIALAIWRRSEATTAEIRRKQAEPGSGSN